MKKRIALILAFALALSLVFGLVACARQNNDDKYEDGKLVLNLRNLYFNEWNGADAYTQYVENKFGVKISAGSYSWADWTQQVQQAINGGRVSDVFHFSLDNYNFARSYQFWADDEAIKPLPDDLSRWPNVKQMVDNTTNIESLRYNGRLWCLPIAKNIKSEEAPFSPFTYVYRRDWAKSLGVYQENDVYTWAQFNALLSAFKAYAAQYTDVSALADVEWGFPSVINFYKDAPHCFTLDEEGKAVSTYTTDAYLSGLDYAKGLVSSEIYYGDQFSANDGDVAKRYYGSRVGVFYENLSLSNYTTIRKKFVDNTDGWTTQQLDDATAIMKVQGPDGNYALEGTDNWFSATFFAGGISDAKMEKVLDILDWLLSKEGTMMAAYGIEGYDYELDANGNVVLLEAGWEKDLEGNYIEKYNGAKYLRYMATLGYDLYSDDPLVDQHAYEILTDWSAEMTAAYEQGKLRILTEPSSIKWLTTPQKASNSGKMLDDANANVMNYVYSKRITTLDQYKQLFQNDVWTRVLDEINTALGK